MRMQNIRVYDSLNWRNNLEAKKQPDTRGEEKKYKRYPKQLFHGGFEL
jgi:hypothetical protein